LVKIGSETDAAAGGYDDNNVVGWARTADVLVDYNFSCLIYTHLLVDWKLERRSEILNQAFFELSLDDRSCSCY